MQKQFTITPDQMAGFRQQATSQGILVPASNSGTVTHDGVSIGYAFDGTTLTLTILSKPFFIPASVIFGELAPYLPA